MSDLTKWTPIGGDEIRLTEGDRVLAIICDGSEVEFRELCDDYYAVSMSPDEAIKALQEAIAWIESKRAEEAK